MTSKRRSCVNDPDIFCYIFGEYMKKENRFNVRDFTKRAYEAYFGMKLGDQDKQWAPSKVCKNCTDTLRLWPQSKVKAMRFGVPMVWRNPKNHHDDCYFCMVDMSGWNRHKKNLWYYPDLESARRPVPLAETLKLEKNNYYRNCKKAKKKNTQCRTNNEKVPIFFSEILLSDSGCSLIIYKAKKNKIFYILSSMHKYVSIDKNH